MLPTRSSHQQLRPKTGFVQKTWSAGHCVCRTDNDEGTFVSVIVYDVQNDLDAGRM